MVHVVVLAADDPPSAIHACMPTPQYQQDLHTAPVYRSHVKTVLFSHPDVRQQNQDMHFSVLIS